MISLYTSDFHLTARDQDEYRWEVFPWLKRRIEHFKVEYLFILGDLTHDKDDHPSALVNRLHRTLREIVRPLRKIIIIKGNHDYDKDAAEPYFGYIHRSYKGKVLYFAEAKEIGLYRQSFLCLPHTRNWRADYQNRFDLGNYDRILMHQQIQGALNEQGQEMEGINRDSLCEAKRIISGDNHVPQKIAKAIYCGAPHPIRFGDHFQPRVLLEENGKIRSIPRQSIKKAVVSLQSSKELKAMIFSSGDRIKVTVELERVDFGRWEKIKRNVAKHCQEEGIHLASIRLAEKPGREENIKIEPHQPLIVEPGQVVERYGKNRKLSDRLITEGKRIIREAT